MKYIPVVQYLPFAPYWGYRSCQNMMKWFVSDVGDRVFKGEWRMWGTRAAALQRFRVMLSLKTGALTFKGLPLLLYCCLQLQT